MLFRRVPRAWCPEAFFASLRRCVELQLSAGRPKRMWYFVSTERQPDYRLYVVDPRRAGAAETRLGTLTDRDGRLPWARWSARSAGRTSVPQLWICGFCSIPEDDPSSECNSPRLLPGCVPRTFRADGPLAPQEPADGAQRRAVVPSRPDDAVSWWYDGRLRTPIAAEGHPCGSRSMSPLSAIVRERLWAGHGTGRSARTAGRLGRRRRCKPQG